MTTTAMTLETKIQEMEAKMPGVGTMLEAQKGGYFDMHFSRRPQDVTYTETEKYRVVATKWEDHTWCDVPGSGGIEWQGYLTVCYQSKEGGKIENYSTEKIVTRDMHDAYKDLPSLWPRRFVHIQPLAGNRIHVAWADKDGKEGPRYELDLETQQMELLG